ILHGAATFGVAAHAIMRQIDYRADQLASFEARFVRPVFPGETISTEIWRDGSQFQFRCRIAARDQLVLTDALAVLRSSACGAEPAERNMTWDHTTLFVAADPADRAFRAEVRDWIAANAPTELCNRSVRIDPPALKPWHRKLYERGWIAPHWPKEYGGMGATL